MTDAPPTHDYDRVSYPTMAHPQTFVDGLAAKGVLRGMAVADPSRARVLELGCGDGFNLAAMAVLHPGATYVGIDYAADAVARGRALLGELGLGQVQLEARDIRNLGRLVELGPFDYIVAHGVFSWVPPDVRQALLTALARLLAPQGVAFVSYLALPGAYQREAARTLVRFHTRATADPGEKIQQARALLDLVARGSTADNVYTRMIAGELELIRSHTDEAFFHDELSDVSYPLLFTEFLEQADRHELEFLSEAEYVMPVGQYLSPVGLEALRPLQQNRILLEQYLDFIEGRRFRQTLLVRRGAPGPTDAAHLARLRLNLRARPVGPGGPLADPQPDTYQGAGRGQALARSPVDKAVMRALAAQPGRAQGLPEILAAARAALAAEGIAPDPQGEAAAGEFLCRAYLPGLIEARLGALPFTLDPPARPVAHPLARYLERRGAASLFTYGGRFVEVEGALGRHLLQLLDGTRDRAALVAALRAFLAAQHQAGAGAGLPAADDPDLPAQLERSLAGLAAMTFIAADPQSKA